MKIAPFDTAGLHYAVRIFLGSAIAWLIVGRFHEINALWAVIAVVSVTEPVTKTALASFKGQAVGTLVGCGLGLVFLICFGLETWLLPVAAMLSAIVSINVFRMDVGWRVAPISSALVMSVGLTTHSTHDALDLAIGRALGIITGSAIALGVTWVMSKLWMPMAVQQQAARKDAR